SRTLVTRTRPEQGFPLPGAVQPLLRRATGSKFARHSRVFAITPLLVLAKLPPARKRCGRETTPLSISDKRGGYYCFAFLSSVAALAAMVAADFGFQKSGSDLIHSSST